MVLELTADLERRLRERVASGRYKDELEVLKEALNLLEEVDNDPAFRRRLLIAELQKGEDDIAAGRYEVFGTEEELKAYLDRV